MDRKTVQVAILSCAVGAGIVGALVVFFPAKPAAPAPEVAKPKIDSVTTKATVAEATPDDPNTFVARPEVDISEYKYLPQNVSLEQNKVSPMLKMPTLISSAKRISGVRPLTDKSRQGEFLNPKWSPDGLQMIASRPGYNGLYVVDLNTGESRLIADGNAFNAKWNPDGTIDVKGQDGTTRTYDAEGTLLGTRPNEAESGPAFAQNDVVYARSESGGSIPITGNDDRYFNPAVSPDGKNVVFQGMLTGLYMAPADGSAAPVYIGPGSNPQWSPDSSGVVFDVTADDGHHLTEGDIFYVDTAQTERTNLTPGDSLISQMPTLDPTGTRVAFEADGVIYVGEVQ
ncbi:hypothetical protein GC173_17330 [bacterium]|nr:hypothetical protein [bacterium]